MGRHRKTKEIQIAKESGTKHTKDKVASTAAQQEIQNELPTQNNAWEMPTTGKSPSAAKSKRSKTATVPAVPWDTPANPPEATKPASKTPSKPASKTTSQKAREAPGGWPTSASNHNTTTKKDPSDHQGADNAEKSASKKSASKKSNKDADAAAGGEADWDKPAAGGQENWETQAQDATAWDTPVGNDAWGAGAQTSGSAVKW